MRVHRCHRFRCAASQICATERRHSKLDQLSRKPWAQLLFGWSNYNEWLFPFFFFFYRNVPNTDSNTVKPKWKVYIMIWKVSRRVSPFSSSHHSKACWMAEEKKRSSMIYLIKRKGLLLALQLSWAASHSPHLDAVKHTSGQTFIPPLHCGASASGWVKHERRRRKGSVNTCLSATVREFQVLGITFPELFRLLLCALRGEK